MDRQAARAVFIRHHEFRDFRLPLLAQPGLFQPEAVELMAGLGAQLIGRAPLALLAMAAPFACRFEQAVNGQHLAAKRAGAAGTCRHRVVSKQIRCTIRQEKGERSLNLDKS